MKIVAYALLCLLCVNSIPAIGMKKGRKKHLLSFFLTKKKKKKEKKETEAIEMVGDEVVDDLLSRKTVEFGFSVFDEEKLVVENLDCLIYVLNAQHERIRSLGNGNKVELVSAQEVINTLECFQKNKEDLKYAGGFLETVRKLLPYYHKNDQFYFWEARKVCDQNIQKRKRVKTGKFSGESAFSGKSANAKGYIFLSRSEGADSREDIDRIYYREDSANDPVFSLFMQERKELADYRRIEELLTGFENRLVKKTE